MSEKTCENTFPLGAMQARGRVHTGNTKPEPEPKGAKMCGKTCENCKHYDQHESRLGCWYCTHLKMQCQTPAPCELWVGRNTSTKPEPAADVANEPEKTCENCCSYDPEGSVHGFWCERLSMQCQTPDPCELWVDRNVYATNTKPEPKQAFTTQVGGNHYKQYAIQPCEFLRRNNVPHAEGEVIYKVLRHRDKNGRDDLEKAIHAIQLILDMDYPKG